MKEPRPWGNFEHGIAPLGELDAAESRAATLMIEQVAARVVDALKWEFNPT